jgi:hypothetical protein
MKRQTTSSYSKYVEGYWKDTPKTLWWRVVAGPPIQDLDRMQRYDLLYGKRDVSFFEKTLGNPLNLVP